MPPFVFEWFLRWMFHVSLSYGPELDGALPSRIKCYIRVSRFFGNFIEYNAEAFDEAMSSFVFAESYKLELPVDYFRVAFFFKKVSICWCYFRPEVSGCGRSDIGVGVRVVLVCFYSCKRIGSWSRCGRCVGVNLRGGGKIAGLTDETCVVVSSGCQSAASYMNVAALVGPYTSAPQMPVAFTTKRLICLGIEGRLSGQLFVQFDYLHMNKITTIVRNIKKKQNAGENMISKEGKVNSVTADYLDVKITTKIW